MPLHSPNVPLVLARSFAGLSAHTGTTNETVLWTYAMPAGLMGANGILRIKAFFSSITNSANTKTFRVRMGAAGNGLAGSIMAATGALTTLTQAMLAAEIANRNAANSQYCLSFSQRVTDQLLTGNSVTTATRDTATAQDIVITAQLASGAETVTPDGYLIELVRGD